MGLESRFHRNARYARETCVVTSGGVYLILIGKTFAVAGTLRRLDKSGAIPLLFVVAYSRNTTIACSGCRASRVSKSVRAAPPGESLVGINACRIAWSKVSLRTLNVHGCDTVKMGSKAATRYIASIGEVTYVVIMEPGWGRRQRGCWPRYPRLTPSICRSVHQMPKVPISVHEQAFLPTEPGGSHGRIRLYAEMTARNKGKRKRKSRKWKMSERTQGKVARRSDETMEPRVMECWLIFLRVEAGLGCANPESRCEGIPLESRGQYQADIVDHYQDRGLGCVHMGEVTRCRSKSL